MPIRRARFCQTILILALLPMLHRLAWGQEVRFQAGRLTARFEAMRLDQVLEAVSERTGVEVKFSDPRTAAGTVSLSLDQTPLIEALRHILRGRSFVLRTPTDNAPEVIVLGSMTDITTIASQPLPRTDTDPALEELTATVAERARDAQEAAERGD